MRKTRPALLRDILLATSALVASSALAMGVAQAGGVSGGKVVVGKASITEDGLTTIINQSSRRALINWDSFSIPSGSTVQFNQPGARGLTVNRVIGNTSSQIFGDLLATGRVWLINSNGILFGKGSQINVGSLIATTSDISDDDVRMGRARFTRASGNPDASVVNQGNIQASDHGSVILSASNVSNDGVIQANLGTVVLGGADAFTVDLAGDNLIRYQVTTPVSQTPKDANGSPVAALVANSGTIQANGGRVLMTARAARSVENSVINNTGMVEATSVSSRNGEIILDAGDGGTVDDSGTLDASGKASGQTGGSVTVAATTINVADGAKIDASGDRGGGQVLIGGGLHGKGSMQHAITTNIGKATIVADAITRGNGGTVAVWSDGSTQFSGTISARGGALSGNGGYVETSGGKLNVDPAARVITTAPHGVTGNWLLDPEDIDIIDGGGDGIDGSNIDPQTIINALADTNVELEATNNITIDSDVIYNSGNTFTMLAEGSIYGYASVQNSGTGNINLIAGWDGVTTDLGSLTNPGVYGNNDGSVFMGTEGAHGNVAIGSFGGVTTAAGAAVVVESDAGYAQLGYAGAGQGDINVFATTAVAVLADTTQPAIIGNGGIGVSGNIGGNIDVESGEEVLVSSNADEGDSRVLAAIGNVGGAESSESGDITINSTGVIGVDAAGVGSEAWIGNLAYSGTTGGATGNITLNTGELLVEAEGDASFAQIGDGGHFTNSGTTGGDITINAAELDILSQGADSQARIANLGAGNVVGDYNITTLGDINLLVNGGALAAIGNGEGGTGTTSGTININAGGNITLDAETDTGNARIASGGAPDSDINVTADGNISLLANGNTSSSFIGGLGGSESGNVSVTSNHGAIMLDAAGDNSLVYIGSTTNGDATGSLLGNITITANDSENGGVSLIASGAGSVAQIGNGGVGSVQTQAGGNISILATSLDIESDNENAIAMVGNGGAGSTGNVNGDMVLNIAGSTSITNNGGLAWIGNVAGEGYNETGNVTLLTGTLDDDNDGLDFTADLGFNDNTGGNVTIGVTGEGNSVLNTGLLQISSPHTFTLMTTGGLTFDGQIENAGSGDINLITGWDTGVVSRQDVIGTDASSLVNLFTSRAGSYGANNGDLTIGGGDNQDERSDQFGSGIGSASGTTTILTGNLVLDASNGFAQIGFAGAGTGDINVQATGNVSLIGGSSEGDYAQIGNGTFGLSGGGGGNITVDAGGDVSLQGGGQPFGTYAQIGNGGDESSGDWTGDISVTGASLALTADEGRAVVGNGGSASSGNFAGDITVDVTGDVTLAGGGVETWGFAMIGNGGDSSEGNDTGDISVTAGGDLTLTGGGDFAQIGEGGWGTDGAHQGDITISAANVAVNGGDVNEFSFAQIGNGGEDSFGDNSGDISITASGDVTLTGTGRYAQIGHGGADSDGNNSGDINVTAAGAVALNGGDGDEAYAQIGHGGENSNFDSQGYSDTGLITVSGDSVSLSGGSGAADYAQIGNGGYQTGANLTGEGTISGDITINSNTTVSLNGGDGDDAYAQIGNGGDRANVTPGADATGSIEGNISVTAQAKNGVTAEAGNGNSAYTQIGNGGFGSFSGAANPSNFTVSGNILVSDLTLIGGSQGDNAYSQIGNGDASLHNAGDISGDITIVTDGGDVVTTDGSSSGSSASIGNASGNGTVTGTVTGGGGGQQGQGQGTQGTIASLIQGVETITVSAPQPPTTFVATAEVGPGSAETPAQSSSSGPMSEMADNDSQASEGKESSDTVANSVGQSLSSKRNKGLRVAQTVIPGLLKQVVLVNLNRPHGVPPADQDYSSWGNEAFWQW